MLIDNSAPARITDDDVRAWATGRRFFVSSPMADTSEERASVAGTLREAGAEAVLFEDLGGRDDDARRAYLDEVAKSYCCLCILRDRYGPRASDGLSATHTELRHAEARGVRVSVWVAQPPRTVEREPALVEMVNEARLRHVTGSYRDPAELAGRVHALLQDFAADDLSPWVKLGQLVFRASRVTLRAGSGELTASLRTGPVAAAIEVLGTVRSERDTQLTVHDRSVPVRIKDVSATRTSSSLVELRVEFDLREPPRPQPMSFSSGSFKMSAEEAVAWRLRGQLFGEMPPVDYVAFWCPFELDQGILHDASLSDALGAAVLRLMMVEALAGGGYVGRVQSVEAGPHGPRGRRVVVTWSDVERYSNVEAGVHTLEGFVPL